MTAARPLQHILLMVLSMAVLGPRIANGASLISSVAQGDEIRLRDSARSAYSSGNVELQQGQEAAASREFDRAIAREKRFFETLGTTRRTGEASYLLQYLTLGGVVNERLGKHAIARLRWSTARDVYETLPHMNDRFAQADRLIEQSRCREAFRVYQLVFVPREGDAAVILRAARAGNAVAARAIASRSRGTPTGDYFAGVLGICLHAPRRSIDTALANALVDYTPTSSDTPNVGPLQASALRLLLR